MRRVLFVPWSVMLREGQAPLDARQGTYGRQVPRYLSLRLEEVPGLDVQFAPYCAAEGEETVFLVPGTRQDPEELCEIGRRYEVDTVVSGLSEFGEEAHLCLQVIDVHTGEERERVVVGDLQDCRKFFSALLDLLVELLLPPQEPECVVTVDCSELSPSWKALSPFFCAIDRLMALEVGGVEDDPAAPFALFFEALADDPGWVEGADQLIGAALDYGMEDRGPIEIGIESLLRLVEGQRHQHKAWGALGYLYGQIEKFEEAVTCLERCRLLDKETFASHHRLGVAYRRLGRQEEAVAVLLEGLAQDPDNIPLLVEAGAALGESDRVQEAVPHFQRAVELSPISGAFYGNLAVALKRAGRREEAIEAFRAGMNALDPHWNVYANYSLELEEQGRYVEWAHVLFQGVQTLVDAPEERYDLAVRLIDGVRGWIGGDWPADVQAKGTAWAVGLLESLLERLPDLPSGWVVLSELYRVDQRPERALDCLTRVEREDPDNVWLKIHLGSVLAGQERYGEAAARFREALALEEDNETALFNLLLISSLQGDRQEAMRCLSRYEELAPADPQLGHLRQLVDEQE